MHCGIFLNLLILNCCVGPVIITTQNKKVSRSWSELVELGHWG